MAGNSILARMAVQIVAQNAKFDAAMRQSQGQMHAFQKSAQGLNNTLRAFGAGFGIYEVARAVSFTISTMANFERQMSTVKAITNATGDELKALDADARRLGASTKFTATEVAQLQVAYGRLGFTTKEILAATEATLSLAVATGEDLAKSADVAGSTVRGFGLDARETIRVVDVMASSFNKSALDLDNFTESMKYVAPVANAAGATVEETTALLSVLADAGIRGSMAGTSLRRIFTDLTKDGRPLAVRMEELAKKGLTLSDSFDEIGRLGMTSLLILSKNTEKTRGLTEAYNSANGEAKRMADTIEDNLIGDVTQLSSAVEGLILQLREGTGPMRDFVQGLTELVRWLSKDEVVQFMKGVAEQALFLNWLKVAKAMGETNDEGERMNKWLKEMDEKAILDAFGPDIDPNNIFASKDWNPFGSAFGKQVQDDIKAVINNLDTLKAKEKELLAQFGLIDQTDKAKLQNTADKIKAVRAEIKAIEDLIATGRRAGKELKMVFTPDLEAEGSLNPELRNDQARNQALELSEALLQVGTSAAFAGGAVIKLEDAAGNLSETMKDVVDIGGLVASGIANAAAEFGRAAIEGGNFGDALLNTLGGFMQSFGASLIALGIGKIALEKFSGPAMIAAGFALTAAGAALSASISGPDLGSGGGGGGSSRGISRFNASTSTQNSSPQLVAVLKGEDIWITLQNYQSGKRFTGG